MKTIKMIAGIMLCISASAYAMEKKEAKHIDKIVNKTGQDIQLILEYPPIKSLIKTYAREEATSARFPIVSLTKEDRIYVFDIPYEVIPSLGEAEIVAKLADGKELTLKWSKLRGHTELEIKKDEIKPHSLFGMAK